MSDILTSVRAKYPGVYDDMPDDELAHSIATKYPVYLNQDPGLQKLAGNYSSRMTGIAQQALALFPQPIASDEAAQAMDYANIKAERDAIHSSNEDYERTFSPAGQFVNELSKGIPAFAHRGGKALLGGLTDAEVEAHNALFPDNKLEGGNLSAFAQNPTAPLPTEQDAAQMSGPARYVAEAAQGAAKVAPALGATAALGGLGVPHTAAAVAPFAFDEHGKLDPVNATMMAALPGIGQLGEAAVGKYLTSKPGQDLSVKIAMAIYKSVGKYVDPEVIEAWLKAGGNQVAANATLLASQAPDIAKSDKPGQAFMDSVMGNLAPSLLAFAGHESAPSDESPNEPALGRPTGIASIGDVAGDKLDALKAKLAPSPEENTPISPEEQRDALNPVPFEAEPSDPNTQLNEIEPEEQNESNQTEEAPERDESQGAGAVRQGDETAQADTGQDNAAAAQAEPVTPPVQAEAPKGEEVTPTDKESLIVDQTVKNEGNGNVPSQKQLRDAESHEERFDLLSNLSGRYLTVKGFGIVRIVKDGNEISVYKTPARISPTSTPDFLGAIGRNPKELDSGRAIQSMRLAKLISDTGELKSKEFNPSTAYNAYDSIHGKPKSKPLDTPTPAAPKVEGKVEKTDTIAGKMDLTEFEKKGYSPEQVTKQNWIDLQRSERRRLGQNEGGDSKNAPNAEYEEFHKQAVADALKKGEQVDPEVAKDYPDLAPKSSKAKPLDTPATAVAKVAEHVDDVKKNEGMRPAKEVKSELVSRVEDAIEAAPSEADLSQEQRDALDAARKYQPKKNGPSVQDAIKSAEGSDLKRITIDIPGDGTFTVWNTKEVLGSLLEKAQRLDTSSGKPVKVERSGIGKADKEWIQNSLANPETKPSNVGLGMGAAIASEEAAEPQRYRIGKSPQTYTHVETLPATKVEIDNGEQPVRVRNEKTGDVTTVLESDLTKVNTVPKSEKVPPVKASIDDQLRAGGYDPSAFSTLGQKKEALKRIAAKKQEPQSLGGQNPNDPGEVSKSNLAQLTDAAKSLKPSDGRPKLADAFNIGAKLAGLRDARDRAVAGLQTAAEFVKERLEGKPVVGDWVRALGDRHLALSESTINARKFRETHEANTTPLLREAISNYLDTGGDTTKLQKGLDEAPDQYKNGYRRALNLTPDEKVLAENIKNYFESRLEDAQKSGILEDGIENYIHRMYEKDSAWKQGAIAELRSGLFTGKPTLAKKRVFETDLDAEKAGYKPVKDYVKRVVAYDLSLNKAIADRQFVKDVMQQTMPDGRPRFDTAGVGTKITDKEGNTKATMIEPRWKPNDPSKTNFRGDYVTYDHPAFRKWKWATKDDNGNPIFVKGNVLVHPDAINDVKALLDKSSVRDSVIGRGALKVGSVVKQTMLDLSGFHRVQIGIHAMEHRTFSPVKEIDFTNPDVRGLVKGGLVVGETSGRSLFDEGLKGSSLVKYLNIPGAGKYGNIGERLQGLNNNLFESYIPRLKVATGLHALKRNRAAYPNLSEEELYHMTASQMNNAFGGLNYEMLGRSKTMQDVERLALLAPDFLEARARFSGQAGTKYGGEQRKALLLGAAAMYVTARIINKLTSGDYHMEPKNAFSIIHNGKAYGLRTVQGDLIHAATDPVGFVRNRLNPAITRPMLEAFTGRNQFGIKRSGMQQLKDEAETAIPISLKGFFSGKEQSVMESFLNSMGVTEHRENASNDIYDKVQKWKSDNKIGQEPGEFIYDKDKDPFRQIKNAAQYYNVSDIKDEVKKAVAGGETHYKIAQHFARYANSPVTGSAKNDFAFVKTLSDDEKATLAKSKQEKQAILQKVMAALKEGAQGDEEGD